MRKLTVILLAAILLFSSFAMSSCGKNQDEATAAKFKTLDDLKDATFALNDNNSAYQPDIRRDLPNVKFDFYTNYFDTFIAVTKGNADTAFTFKYTFISLKQSYPDLTYVESTTEVPIVANFSPYANDLKEDFNKFIVEARESGLLDELAAKWLDGYYNLTDESAIIDFSDLEDINGTFTFGTPNDNIPYNYLRNGKLTGYETALVYEFCKAHGYKPEVVQTDFTSVLAGTASGKYDMGVGAYGYTEERANSSNFSDSYFTDKVVFTVMGEPTTQVGIWDKIKNSFERNFIQQHRWQLLANGLVVTVIVTVLSVLVGALLGFALFLASRKMRWLEKLSLCINDTLEALPILVVLLVFFYVIFGSSKISGVAVSVMVFAMCFTFTFFALMCNSVRGVPKDQTEAGLALGYNDRQTLFKVVLPQAMEAFLPSIKSAIIATLKGTAVVGYVAVQDLTKAGDLIRSQTFDAFFPIITVALMYFLIAKFLIALLNKLLRTPSDKRKLGKEGK